MKNDLSFHRMIWSEAINLVQNWPLWRLMANTGAMHS